VVAQHLAGQRVEVADLGQQQLEHGAGVEALVAEQGDGLAGDPHRGHPPTQLVGQHGDVVGRALSPVPLGARSFRRASRPTR
jgi:hypothetical protein